MIDWKDCMQAVQPEIPQRKYVWVAYQQEPPRLPIAIADTAHELARKLGVRVNNIESLASKARRGKIKNARYMCVYIG